MNDELIAAEAALGQSLPEFPARVGGAPQGAQFGLDPEGLRQLAEQ